MIFIIIIFSFFIIFAFFFFIFTFVFLFYLISTIIIFLLSFSSFFIVFLSFSSSSFSCYCYLLLYFYPSKSHRTRLPTQLHHDEQRKDQEEHRDGGSIFWTLPAWLTWSPSDHGLNVSPISYTCPLLTVTFLVWSFLSPLRNPLALSDLSLMIWQPSF